MQQQIDTVEKPKKPKITCEASSLNELERGVYEVTN
jgi:hypothetical protein